MARLVARGLGNQAIADELWCSASGQSRRTLRMR
ncbi:MAG: hypothetical protein U0360_01890 [Dehalococcoidia bacterium]